MAIISKPISLSNLLKTEFGITNSSSLTALSPYTVTGLLYDGYYYISVFVRNRTV